MARLIDRYAEGESNGYRVVVERNFMWDGLDVWVLRDNVGSRSRTVVRFGEGGAMELHRVEEGAELGDPSLRLEHEHAGLLFAIADAANAFRGVLPGNAGELKATRDHLSDMQSIAFKLTNHITEAQP